MADTATANISKPTRLESYVAEVLPPARAAELFRSLPSHIKPAVFERNLVNALMANPELMQHPPALVYREVAKVAGLGLYLDPQLGEAYIVIAYNYKSKRQEPQLRIGYKGMMKLVRQTGNVTTISCHEVHALDHVEVDFGIPKVFHHRPRLFTERGPILGYVATIAFKDGSFDLEPMSVQQCLAIRDRSDAWRAFKEGKIRSTPWSTDEVEMCKKSNLRRLLKRQEQSPEIARANEIEDEAEYGSEYDAGEIAARQAYRLEARAPQGSMIAGPSQDQAEPTTTDQARAAPHTLEPIDTETGEVETWQQWGARMIAAVRTSVTESEIDSWLHENRAFLADFKKDAPETVFKILDNAIAKHRTETRARGEKQQGDAKS